MTVWGARWYDMDGTELHDMHAVNALLGDIAARRVALTDFDGRAEVSTVLLVLDHNWVSHGPPHIFETMTFRGARTWPATAPPPVRRPSPCMTRRVPTCGTCSPGSMPSWPLWSEPPPPAQGRHRDQ